MTARLEVWDSSTSTWVDKTSNLTQLRRRITSRQIESLDGELVNDELAVGDSVRLLENNTVVFEGVVYEVDKQHRSGDVRRCSFTAHTNLIKYDTHIVFRSYTTGTYAGDIIKDLAALESGVDTSNVDNGPQLQQDWEIQ